MGCAEAWRAAWLGSPAVPRRTVILLPPSEGKAGGGDGPSWRVGTMAVDDLDAQRAQLLRALGRAHPARTGPTRPAIDRYTGVLYRELDATTLRGTPRRRFRRDVLIASGLWGLVAPMDLIPDYKLKMGARVDPLGKLSTWWRPAITAALAPRVDGATVWDLLPNEHAAAIDWTRLRPGRRVTVRFVDQHDKTVAHWNKLLKGSVVRWLAETGATDPATLADFEHPQGYRLDRPGSDFAVDRAELVMRQSG